MPRQALVSPAADLTRAELTRYARQISLPHIGLDGQRRLKNSRVVVLGAGGLGSPVLQYLAAAGVGTIGIVDHDTVEVSNLQRQTIHPDAAVGSRKTASAAAAVRALNPLVEVIEHDVEITPDTVLELVSEYDVVVDGTDAFEVQYVIDAACALVGKPMVWGSVLRFDGQATVFWATAEGDGARTLDDLYPEQGSDPAESCAVAGVLGPVCAAIGAVMATETLKLLGGWGEVLLGRLLVHDALDASWREVPFGKSAIRPGTKGATRGAANIGEPYDAKVQGVGASSPATRLFERQAGNTAKPTTTTTTTTESESAPPAPASVSPSELKEMLDARERGDADFVLVDVRESYEHELVAIDGAHLVPLAHVLSDAAREVLPPQEKVVLYCHHDTRSAHAAQLLQQNGWDDVVFVRGGIDAWVREIEPDKPRY
ncbi:ThiF family adenylyltransferase [Herbiconiux sp. KACC 21604]|uniref:ThiF family adenylyltransferase n=1 Tax=unclassified Herbiconiux TaxID=2618217 RepID=UPI001490E667|nr:ThiF family adenylyltransferase [Herbiconiux sp. SALV-R1]QJU54016.1 adenylyltransferase/sulfurtransferase MoeZ [Herbiconiux sp. SALV-R1]WPO85048.1 ThiF family adenylyltransferase [Herbiconiux sp. KACC 21604]